MTSLFEQASPDRQGTPPKPIPAIVWLDPSQADFVRDVADRAAIDILAAGGQWTASRIPSPSNDNALQRLPGERFDDLRRAIADTNAPLLISFTASDTDQNQPPPAHEHDTLTALSKTGMTLLTLAPLTSRHAWDAANAATTAGPPPLAQVPLMLRSPLFADLREALEPLGAIRSLVAHFHGSSIHASAGARFFDAITLAHALLGEPEQVDAAIVPPPTRTGTAPPLPQSLASLRGDIHATLRYTGGRAATVAASDQGGRWSRGVTIVTENAVLRVNDSGFEAFDSRATPITHATATSPRHAKPGGAIDAASVVADAIRQTMEPRSLPHAPINAGAILAICQAAILSARTGQGESPATIRHVEGW